MKYWESRLILAGSLVLLLFGTGEYWSRTWLSKWAVLVFFFGAALSWVCSRRTSFWHLPLLLYAFWNIGALAVWPQQSYRSAVDDVTLLAMQKNALYALMQFTLLACLFAGVTRRASRGILISFSAICLIGTVGILCLPFEGNRSPPNNGIWFGNPSMGASLLACLLPFIWVLTEAWALRALAWGLVFIAAYRTRASIPWGVLGVVTAAYFFSRARPRQRIYACYGISLLAVVMIVAGMHFIGDDFWDSNNRAGIWRMSWDWWRAHGSLLTGMGYATSQILTPLEQISTGNYHGGYFMWLHSDWLQLLIEGGVIGMACVLLSLSRLLLVSWHYPPLFAALAGFVAMGLFDYPLRMPIHCWCLALICGIAEAHVIRRGTYLGADLSRTAF